MEYNTQKSPLVIPEYGRNVHTMINHCKEITDKKERNEFAECIIQVMGNINPQLRDIEDWQHKLWDHLFIMADFDLDVDSPYPLPERGELQKKPDRIPYQKELRMYRYYGRIIQEMIDEVKTWEPSEKRDAATLLIANKMKQSYLSWNKKDVDDDIILADLKKLSDGKLELPENMEIAQNVQSVAPKNTKNNKQRNKKRKK